MVPKIPLATIINVVPFEEDDWEILELHAGYLEEQLLNQVRTVYKDQIICIWINQQALVRLRVGKIYLVICCLYVLLSS